MSRPPLIHPLYDIKGIIHDEGEAVVALGDEANRRPSVVAPPSHNYVALKAFPLPIAPALRVPLVRAATVQRAANHPCVVGFKAVSLTRDYLWLEMEYVHGSSLKAYLVNHIREFGRALPERQARRIFCDIICGLGHLHDQDMAYRQLKLDHVLLTADAQEAKVCDFLCSRAGSEFCTTKIGCPQYTAPEIWQLSDRHVRIYDGRKADVWSCGVILYCMLYGRFPFAADANGSREQTYLQLGETIQRMNVKYDADSSISPACVDLMRNILCHVDERLTIDQIMGLEWFRQGYRERRLVQVEPSTRQSINCIVDRIRAACFMHA